MCIYYFVKNENKYNKIKISIFDLNSNSKNLPERTSYIIMPFNKMFKVFFEV